MSAQTAVRNILIEVEIFDQCCICAILTLMSVDAVPPLLDWGPTPEGTTAIPVYNKLKDQRWSSSEPHLGISMWPTQVSLVDLEDLFMGSRCCTQDIFISEACGGLQVRPSHWAKMVLSQSAPRHLRHGWARGKYGTLQSAHLVHQGSL